MARPLTERDFETLDDLASTNRDRVKNLGAEYEWAKPMDIGASDASHHSATLKKLGRRGLVDIEDASTKRPGCSKYWRAGCRYKINIAGQAALDQRKAARRD